MVVDRLAGQVCTVFEIFRVVLDQNLVFMPEVLLFSGTEFLIAISTELLLATCPHCG